MKRLRVLVADDELPARRWMRTLLAAEPDVELVAECSDGSEVVRATRELEPDVLFLDVRMPGLDGFEVIQTLGKPPAVVFVTAHASHAVRAFDVAAVDYLLKPFDAPRLSQALERVRRAQESGSTEERWIATAGGKVTLLRFSEIDWIQAAGNYLRVHAHGRVSLARATLESIASKAAAHGFVRVHRSHMVRAAVIASVEPAGSGDLLLQLRDGTKLRASRRYRPQLTPWLERR